MPCFCDTSNKFHDSAIILGKLGRLDKLSTSGTGKNDFLFCSASQHGTWEMNPEGNPHATLICTRMELFQFIIHHHPLSIGHIYLFPFKLKEEHPIFEITQTKVAQNKKRAGRSICCHTLRLPSGFYPFHAILLVRIASLEPD